MMTLMSVATAASMMFTACSNDDLPVASPSNVREAQSATNNKDKVTPSTGGKTVLVYMAGRNSLSVDVDFVELDLKEIKEGSKRIGKDDNLLVYVCRHNGAEQPWLARIQNGEVTDSVSLDEMGIRSSDGQNRASDPAVMEGVMHYAFRHYPSANSDYGLVLWGHGSGWLMMDEVKPACSRAFGVDNGKYLYSGDNRWINIPAMTNILESLPHLKYIMFDCCNMMCLENLYGLRSVCDYIIGSPAEIPDHGAPYNEILPDLFGDGAFYSRIIEKYAKSVDGLLPLTAVKTSEMGDVAQATREALQAVKTKIGDVYPDMKGLIHYNYASLNLSFDPCYNIFYDAGDFFLAHAPEAAYKQWRQALDRAIVELHTSTTWHTDMLWRYIYTDFTATDAKMHGVSMFVPQDPDKGNYAKYNEDIKQTSWYKALN